MATSNTAKTDDYILNRDWPAMARLNERHHLFKMIQGFLVHPSITLQAGAKVADIGGGTCIWAVELLNELPFCIDIDAVDISLAQCPPKAWLPNEIHLIAHDVYQPFPDYMIGKYDLVHVQNWLCIWRNDTSEQLIRNLTALLKPSGYLQWSEQDPAVNRIIRAPDSTSSTEATEQLLRFLSKPRESTNFEWVSQLGPTLAQHHSLVAFDRQQIRQEFQAFWNITVLQGCEELASNLQRKANLDEEASNAVSLRKVVTEASRELLNGIGIYTELVVAVVQKIPTAMV